MCYSMSEIESLRQGFQPKDMDDRWKVSSIDDWIYFTRSWTGHCIFAIKIANVSGEEYKVTESWFNANPDEYNSMGRQNNQQVLKRLIKSLFGILR